MRITVDQESMPVVKGRFSQALRSDPFVFQAGLIASDFQTGLDPSVKTHPGFPFYGVPIKSQTDFVLDLHSKVAQSAGTSLDRAVHVWSILTDVRDTALAEESRRGWFDAAARPAGSTYGVRELAADGALIEIDAVLAAPGFSREIIRSPRAPQPPDEFGVSQAVKVGSFIFVSSQAATDFVSGIAPEARLDPGFPYFGSDVKRQAEYALRNMGAILAEAGSSLEHVVKAQVFLPDLSKFAELDEVWRAFFPQDPPARSVIPARLTIPGSLIELNAIAIVPDGHLNKETVRTDRAPLPTIHEPQAVKAGDFVFLSQLMATDYEHGLAPAGHVDPWFPNHDSEIKRQLTYVFENADTILQAAGSSIHHVVRRQAYFSDFKDNFPGGREITVATFAPDPPPSTTVSVGTDLLVPGCRFLLDAMGVVK
ncbi:MAG: hypothetical protein IT307_17225 [Chloroflexi bacterium]|nr:hypothetical protein [Chloroflexota bacterium]